MQIVAGEWWESGSWWQFAITIAAGIGVCAVGAWATLRASNPKRQLNWWVQSSTSLMSVPRHSPDGEIALTFQGVAIDNPRLVELVITNGGRRDITSAMFHNNESIRFDFDAVVCTVLDVTTTPQGSVLPSLDTDPWRILGTPHPSRNRAAVGGTWLDVRPSLLTSGQAVTVAVLLDGEEKPVKCVHAPLIEVRVKEAAERRPLTTAPWLRETILAALGALTVWTAGVVLVAWLVR
ncbi:hypothetical protein ABZ960_20485 [Streptomyces pseudovenezuelae]|uniref:hypothetical protein n=1 Tax=Streptomyces pseudovenezuelae TaxID=67350 RepID=UPI0034A11017